MSKMRAMDEDVQDNVRHEGDDGPEHQDELVPQGLTSNKSDNQSPGEMLREARLAHEYSVSDLCAQTMLSKHTVEALEDDRFEELSQPVFVRGYYRKCAKVLDIDAERLLAAYAASGSAHVPVTQQSFGTPIQVVSSEVTSEKRRSFGLVFLIFILIVVGVAGYLYWSQNVGGVISDDVTTGISLMTEFDSLETSTGAEDASSPAISKPLPISNAADNDQSAGAVSGTTDEDKTSGTGSNMSMAPMSEPGVENSKQLSVATIAPADKAQTDNVNELPIVGNSPDASAVTGSSAGISTEPSSAGTALPSAVAASVPAATALSIEFDERSWVNIHDSTGAQLLVGIYDGTTRTLDGVPPYDLVIGYGPGVKVHFGGEPVQFNVAGDNTARFTVGVENN